MAPALPDTLHSLLTRVSRFRLTVCCEGKIFYTFSGSHSPLTTFITATMLIIYCLNFWLCTSYGLASPLRPSLLVLMRLCFAFSLWLLLSVNRILLRQVQRKDSILSGQQLCALGSCMYVAVWVRVILACSMNCRLRSVDNLVLFGHCSCSCRIAR